MKYVLKSNGSRSRRKYLTYQSRDDGEWLRQSSGLNKNAFGYTPDLDLARIFDTVEDTTLYMMDCAHQNGRQPSMGPGINGFSIERVEEVRPAPRWRSLGTLR